MQRTWLWCVLAGAAGCGGWFEDGRACEPPASRCRGDSIQLCQPQVDDTSRYEWETVHTCVGDTVLGPLTCGYEDGDATCVRALDDSEEAQAALEDVHWARVDVRREGNRFALSVDETVLPGHVAPISPLTGSVAAVSYAGDTVLDATLVRFATQAESAGVGGVSVAQKDATVWLRIEGADRVVLLSASGTELDEVVLGSRDKSRGVGVTSLGLGTDLPPTLRLLTPRDQLLVPTEIVTAMGPLVEVAGEPLDWVRSVHQRAPELVAHTITALGFVSRSRATPDDAEDSGKAESSLTPQQAEAARRASPAFMLVGTTLLVNVAPVWLEQHRGARAEFEVSYLDALARAYVSLSRAPGLGASTGLGDYPTEVAERILARVSPILARDEDLPTAWAALHQVGVKAGLAGPYLREAWESRDAADARRDGFASPLGGQGAESDFAQYAARLLAPGGWPYSPCDDLLARELSSVPAGAIVAMAKIEVLHGLGLVSDRDRSRCLGELSDEGTEGVVAYSSRGERLQFTDSVEGVRQLLPHGESQFSVSAIRGETSALVSVSCRERCLGLHRLLPVGQRAEPEIGAGVFFVDPALDDYGAQSSLGGIVLAQRLSEEELVVRALLVQQSRALWGSDIWPVVVARVKVPLWLAE